MENQSKQAKMNTFRKMLYELAIGNWSFRIKIDKPVDELDQMIIMLNTIAEKTEVLLLEIKLTSDENERDNESHKLTAEELANKIVVYIHNHLSEPLPAIKKIAKTFETNECFLKESFKKTTNTSIHQYYNDERLKKSYNLIEQTTIPLKEIAFQCGFNSYLNFYKAFRKKYNYSPSEIIRQSDFG